MPANFAETDLIMQAKAFEYVVGTLRGREREDFKRHLSTHKSLQSEVDFWQEQLMLLPQPESIAPAKNIWPLIQTRLDNLGGSSQTRSLVKGAGWRRWLHWLAPSVLAVCATLFVTLFLPVKNSATSQYVAVLTDTKGDATLTAFTQGEQHQMQLQWQPLRIADGKDIQLWAVSRRDGTPRSLAVFSSAHGEDLMLNDAQLRLVKDAQYLILTEEEDGGSAVDEPSELILAKGICVHLSRDKS